MGSLERLEELGSLERWGIVAPAGAGARGTREFSGGLRPVGRAMTPPFLRHEALRLGAELAQFCWFCSGASLCLRARRACGRVRSLAPSGKTLAFVKRLHSTFP